MLEFGLFALHSHREVAVLGYTKKQRTVLQFISEY
jgi:hypothetical protein